MPGSAPIGGKDQRGNEGWEVRGVHQRMGAERRENAHLLLRMVDGVKSPQAAQAMVGYMRHSVSHGIDSDGGDEHDECPGTTGSLGQHEEGSHMTQQCRGPHLHEREEREHHDCEQEQVRGIDAVRPGHCRPPDAAGRHRSRAANSTCHR